VAGGVQQSGDDGLCDSAGARIPASGGGAGRGIGRLSGARRRERLPAVCPGRAPDLLGSSAAALSGDDPGGGNPGGAVSVRDPNPVAIGTAPASPPRPGTDPSPRTGHGRRTRGSAAGSSVAEMRALPGLPALGEPPPAGTGDHLYVAVRSRMGSPQRAGGPNQPSVPWWSRARSGEATAPREEPGHQACCSASCQPAASRTGLCSRCSSAYSVPLDHAGWI